jgi:hypothetical protein
MLVRLLSGGLSGKSQIVVQLSTTYRLYYRRNKLPFPYLSFYYYMKNFDVKSGKLQLYHLLSLAYRQSSKLYGRVPES